MSRRVLRVEKELQQIVASYLLTGFHQPLPAMVSVTRTQVNPDLRSAKVFLSFLGSEEDGNASFEILQGAIKEVQSEVGHKLQAKFCPRLTFIQDRGQEQLLKVERLLAEISRQKKN